MLAEKKKEIWEKRTQSRQEVANLERELEQCKKNAWETRHRGNEMRRPWSSSPKPSSWEQRERGNSNNSSNNNNNYGNHDSVHRGGTHHGGNTHRDSNTYRGGNTYRGITVHHSRSKKPRARDTGPVRQQETTMGNSINNKTPEEAAPHARNDTTTSGNNPSYNAMIGIYISNSNCKKRRGQRWRKRCANSWRKYGTP